MSRRIEQYTGPYERWVYEDDLGRPFSFPAIRDRTSRYFSALMDSDRPLPLVTKLEFQSEPDAPKRKVRLRYPPLWNRGNNLKVRPFCFYDPDVSPMPATGLGDIAASLLDLVATAADEPEENVQPGEKRKRARFRVNFPINEGSWTGDYDVDHGVAGFKAPATPPKAIIAVIDDGLPFAHRAFRRADGTTTRVSHCWLQSARAPQGSSAVPFGREYSNGQINDLIADHGDNEDALYRAAGALDRDLPELGDYMRRGVTHGSHIMSLAAGKPLCGKDEPSQDDIEIIAVQLPNTIAWDTSGFGKEMYMLSAIHYVFERAQRLAQACGVDELPLVINFSYGWSGGRHDGGSEMDAAIAELLGKRRDVAETHLVMPSGNTFLNQMHAQFLEADFDVNDDPEKAANELRIYWQVQPDDRTSSYAEFWFPPGFDPDGYSFEITPPRGLTFDATPSLDVRGDPALPRGDDRAFLDLSVGGAAVGQMSVDFHRHTRWRAMVALAPTLALARVDGRRAPAGRWTLRLKRSGTAAKLGEGEYINLWVQRDDDPAELKTGGRQAYLERTDPKTDPKPSLPEYKQPLGPVRGFGSLNGVANAPQVTRVAGYVQSTGRPAPYSSSGGLSNSTAPAPAPWGVAVDVCAVADRSPIRPGSLGQGVRSGSRALLVGTSGAAPQAARVIVRALADGKPAFDGMTPQSFAFKDKDGNDLPIKNAHWAARLGGQKTPPLWGGG